MKPPIRYEEILMCQGRFGKPSPTPKFLQVPVGESKTIKSEKGIILVSDTAMDISGTITVQADKMLVLFCPIDIVVTNPDAESELDITAYFFD